MAIINVTRNNPSDAFLARQPVDSLRTRFFGLVDTWPALQDGDLVVTLHDENQELAAVGHFMPYGGAAEIALIVDDSHTGRGYGSLMMKIFYDLARERNIKILAGEVLSRNRGMLALADKFGYKVTNIEPTVKRITKRVIS